MKRKIVINKIISNIIIKLIIFFSVLIMLLPLIMVLSGSLMGKNEITDNIGMIFNKNPGKDYAFWPLIPQFPTLKGYVELLLDTPKFFVMFWNSCKMTFASLIGQLIVGIPAAWAFAVFNFKGKKLLFGMYILLMILPFQVTMVSSYLVLDKLNCMNTYYSVILPNIFATLPVFIMTKFFKAIPKSLIESARVDGAGEFDIFLFIGIPLGKSGIMSAFILSFLDLWNNIEQPITFLKDKSLWPLSLFLSDICSDNLALALSVSVIMLLPSLLIFLAGEKNLESGIAACGLKE